MDYPFLDKLVKKLLRFNPEERLKIDEIIVEVKERYNSLNNMKYLALNSHESIVNKVRKDLGDFDFGEDNQNLGIREER